MKIKGSKKVDQKELERKAGIKAEDIKHNGVLTENSIPEADEVDIDLGEMTFEETEKEVISPLNPPIAAQEVEDEDFGDVGSSDELYHLKEEQKKADSKVLDAVDSNMSEIKASMNDVILKQAQVLEKNADSMQSMQENLTTVVKSQSEMVSTISKAIDKKLTQQEIYVSGLVEEKVVSKVGEAVCDAVEEPLYKQKRKRRRRQRNQFIGGILRFIFILFVFYILLRNDYVRVRIGLVVTEIKNIVVDIVTGDETTSNKLIKDLGVNLNEINTVYYDEDGNEISKEEYLEKIGEDSSETFDINK